jgi:hypothetical protein
VWCGLQIDPEACGKDEPPLGPGDAAVVFTHNLASANLNFVSFARGVRWAKCVHQLLIFWKILILEQGITPNGRPAAAPPDPHSRRSRSGTTVMYVMWSQTPRLRHGANRAARPPGRLSVGGCGKSEALDGWTKGAAW